MFKWIITFIFTNVLVTICAPPRPQPAPPRPHYLRNKDVPNTQLAELFLRRINIEEVLPIVLFQTRQIVNTLDVPDDIDNAAIWEMEMVNGTTFTKKGSRRQLFFCPKLVQNEHTQEVECCLAPRVFHDLEPLRCAKVSVPTVIPSLNRRCSFQDEAFLYYMAYEFCNTKEYKYVDRSVLSIYDFCFDAGNRKTLYTLHSIRSAKLLQSNLLYRERQVVYEYLHVNGLPTANRSMIESLLRVDQQSTSTTTLYRVQQLVPEEDMAFANWKKTTRQFLNTELQHPQLFQIWNDINSTVRTEAIQVSDDGNTFNIFTGVFDNGYDLPANTNTAGQKYNKWVKVITLTNAASFSAELAGVAILMNNFLNFHTNDRALQSVQNELARLCPFDFCANSNFKIRVDNVGGQMRCCRINPLIAQFVNLQISPDLPLLNIPGLTGPPRQS